MVEFCINQAFNSPFSFIWFYLHPRPHIWHIKPICDVNEEKNLKIAIYSCCKNGYFKLKTASTNERCFGVTLFYIYNAAQSKL